MELVKAELKCIDGGSDIKFMFNPSQLAFEGVVETSENPGARTQKQGKPKVSFSNIKAYKITINNILFDTYEEGDDVVKKYINNLKKAVEFSSGKERPPVYRFMWGEQMYMKCCFIEKLNYKLTMFLPNGTPVRAVIDSLTLKEADEPKPNQSVAAPKASNKVRQTDNMKSRSKNNRRIR